jgi:mitochondrial import receptor subunit TOM40
MSSSGQKSQPVTTLADEPHKGGLFYSLKRMFSWLDDKKKHMGLECPGPFETLHKEARNVSLNHLIFEGGKLDLSKMLSMQFQISHSMNLGSSSVMPNYYFATVFAGNKNLIQGMIDHQGDLQGKCHYAITEKLMGKMQVQVSSKPGYSMMQLEADYMGNDYSANLKAINPDLTNLTGLFTAAYFQSITKNLAVGVEGILQRSGMPSTFGRSSTILTDAGVGYAAKYQWGPSGLLTLQLQNLMALQASYFHKVNETVELGTELQCVLAGPKAETVATMGCKMEYRQAILRAQLDSLGRVAMFLEERLFGRVSLLLSGEIDHINGRSRFGVGLSMEN